MDDGERYNTSTSLMGTDTNADPSYARNGKIMLCSVVSIIAIVILIAGFHSYARWLFHREQERDRRRRFIQRQRNRHLIFTSDVPTTTPNNSRLDPSVLKSLPTFLYSSTTHAPSLSCAVCLSDFEEKEKGRLLPRCKHCFHVECIDMWFYAHSNCPLCRASVRPDISVAPAEEPVERVLWLDEPAELSFGWYPPPGQRGGDERPCSCSCPSSSSRGVPELVGIAVEMPRRNDIGFRRFEDQLGMKSPGSHGFS